jgi:hypothetical protein
MVASRIRVLSACQSAPFWLSAFCAALMPTSIGYQDLAALLARERGAAGGLHLLASPFGTVESATFSYTRPIGTAIPEPLGLFQTVNFDPRSLDAYAWKVDEPLIARAARQIEYPIVDRGGKGDRLPVTKNAPAAETAPSPPQLQPVDAPSAQPAPQVLPSAAPAEPPRSLRAEQHTENNAAAPTATWADIGNDTPIAAPSVAWADIGNDTPIAAPHEAWADIGNDTPISAEPAAPRISAKESIVAANAGDDIVLDKPPELPRPGEIEIGVTPAALDELAFVDGATDDRTVYFGGGVMGAPLGLQNWAPGAEPILTAPTVDPDIKLSALEAAPTGAAADIGGETVAGKGDSNLVQSPAERLGLSGKPRAQAQKCLADAVYFEARGEEFKGQQAVAQVVMNRVFSGYYPHDVCGVVYQNANRHLACQFTFACEGKDLSQIDEPDMWEQAKQIAKDMLDGKIWLTEVGHATHYHAYWVHPSWVHEMTKLYHLGVHTFYRPRAWGDGGDAPFWGNGPSANNAETPAAKADAPSVRAAPASPEPTAKSPAAATQGPQAAAKSPEVAAAVKSGGTAKL